MKYQVTKPISLLEALQKMYEDSSNTTLRKFLKFRRVRVDQEIAVKGNSLVESGQTITVDAAQKKSIDKEPSHGIKILFEDPHLLIVYKPSKILSVPLDEKESPNVLDILKSSLSDPNIRAVHRLDKDASGVMVYARNQETVLSLNKMFKEHDLTRVYLACVQGIVEEDQGCWESELLEEKNRSVKKVPKGRGGKKATTYFEVVHRSEKHSLLKLTLETGRKHQIRVHCRDAGHPILGDKRYGKALLKTTSRMLLHASFLAFVHPITKEPLSFSSPLPKGFSKNLSQGFLDPSQPKKKVL